MSGSTFSSSLMFPTSDSKPFNACNLLRLAIQLSQFTKLKEFSLRKYIFVFFEWSKWDPFFFVFPFSSFSKMLPIICCKLYHIWMQHMNAFSSIDVQIFIPKEVNSLHLIPDSNSCHWDADTNQWLLENDLHSKIWVSFSYCLSTFRVGTIF